MASDSGAPSKAEIARFLQAMDILGRFEGEMRLIRGYGASFDPKEWPDAPDPIVIKVRRWLETLHEVPPAGRGDG